MDATTIRVREPRELLALLPYQLGFRPERSAVAVALRPPRGRVGLIARVDLVDLAAAVTGPQLARRLVTHLVGDGAAQAVLVVYADEDPRIRRDAGTGTAGARTSAETPVADDDPHVGGALSRHDAATDAITAARTFRQAAEAFLGEVAVWVVAPSGYLSLDCADVDCCPPGGRPLHDLQATEVGAHMVLAGAMVADSREALVPDIRADAGARRNATRAAARRLARRAIADERGGPAVARWRAEGLASWRAELDEARRGGSGPAPAALGGLIAALGDVVVRDAILLTLVPGAAELPERIVAASATVDGDGAGAEVARVLAAVVSPRDGVPPDPQLHVPATVVLERVVSHAVGPARAPGLTLLGLLAWWGGDGARAAVLVDRALAAEPGHRLAQLLGEALGAGLAPGWVHASR